MIVFIDESGDHNLDLSKLDNNYTVFVLAAVCFSKKNDYDSFDQEFRSLKRSLFGTEDFIIHTDEINRPNRSKNDLNLKFNCPKFRKNFYEQVNQLIRETNFKIIARAINKVAFSKQYSDRDISVDPYNFSFEYILNRIIFDAKDSTPIEIYPEERNTPENIRLLTEYEKIRGLGTKFISSKEIKEKIKKFQLISKTGNDSGLQLADLIVSPIGRHILNKPPRLGNEILFSIVKEKLREKRIEIYP